MKAWIQDIDEDTVAFVHGTSGEDLDTLVTHCRESSDFKQSSDWKLAASVDGTVIIDWCNKRGITWAQFMGDQKIQIRFLDDPDNGVFRVWKGRI
jgi:hypothetical protein